MSELKAYTPKELVMQGRHNEPIYIKSEADKVIAEKDKEIEELNDKLQNVSELLKETREWLIESQKMHKRCADGAIKKIRHQKFKRCLKNREICVMRFDKELARQNPTRCFFWSKWERKWLELADKFKEAK